MVCSQRLPCAWLWPPWPTRGPTCRTRSCSRQRDGSESETRRVCQPRQALLPQPAIAVPRDEIGGSLFVSLSSCAVTSVSPLTFSMTALGSAAPPNVLSASRMGPKNRIYFGPLTWGVLLTRSMGKPRSSGASEAHSNIACCCISTKACGSWTSNPNSFAALMKAQFANHMRYLVTAAARQARSLAPGARPTRWNQLR